MKHCPSCNRGYSDTTLEFCLEDGSRLFVQGTSPSQTVAIRPPSPSSSTETISFPTQNPPKTIEIGDTKSTVQNKGEAIKKTVVNQSIKVLEVTPIILALAHNYWQWLYVSNQSSSNLIDFIVSVHFGVWLILLIAAAVISLIALKFGQNRGFAYASLVILAINFILFLVPRR